MFCVYKNQTARRMEELTKARNEHGFENVWTRFSSRKMEATKQNYFMVEWNKRHIA